MVRSSLPTLALLALSASTAAVPAANPPAAPFTMTQWIEGIIADPAGDHLTPEEAVAAWNATRASAGSLDRRASCWEGGQHPRANANDAASCLDDLARKGAAGVMCGIPDGQYSVSMCRIGNSEIVGQRSVEVPHGTNCNDVARTGGLIFDSCYRSDNTVLGYERCINDPVMAINIWGF